MIMKNTVIISLACVVVLALTSCQKDFLDRFPQTSVTENSTFKTPADLETYTNGFYGMIGPNYSDGFTDNIAGMSGSSTTDAMVRGNLTIANAGGWGGWDNVRRINFMLQRVANTTGDQASINHFVGIARFFRANLYYNMVMTYGDVPWYNQVIKDTDEDLLMKKQDSRTLVVDSIMADLEYAVAHIKPGGTNTRVTKWVALTLLSRIALYEGTYRKYHTYLNLEETAHKFLERSASASKQIMDQGGFSITNTGKLQEDYRNLFVSKDLSANKEIIYLWKNGEADGVANNTHTVFDYQWALSKDLMEEFLMKDGSRFTSLPDYDKKQVTEIFKNRDPRLAENIMEPGFKTNPDVNIPYVLKPSYGGYLQIKFYPRDPNQRKGWNLNYTDLPMMRYAEVLLNYAEAQAELGKITQGDLDLTIGVLRRRVGMPTLKLADAQSNIDPIMASKYSNVKHANKGIVLEIRRERRIELASEGFRFNDLNRWYVGELFAVNPKGIYVPGLGALDVTGDGEPDLVILEKESDKASLPEKYKALPGYYVSENNIYLSNGSSGHIVFFKDKNQPRQWVDGPKYYYRPIPIGQTVLNPNLIQPLGWR